jgi:hypothetical protein
MSVLRQTNVNHIHKKTAEERKNQKKQPKDDHDPFIFVTPIPVHITFED